VCPSSESLKRFKAIIVSGGPQSVYDPKAPAFDRKVNTLYFLCSLASGTSDDDGVVFQILSMGKPVLGICYGLQLITHVSGGSVRKHTVREDGQFAITVTRPTSALFEGLPSTLQVLLTHGDSVAQVSPLRPVLS
jgi:GMP synthase (glutamine-hydrolysing)